MCGVVIMTELLWQIRLSCCGVCAVVVLLTESIQLAQTEVSCVRPCLCFLVLFHS